MDLLTGVVDWAVVHWQAPVAVVAWGAALHGWSRLREQQARRGRAVPPLGDLTRRLVRFALREDTQPLLSRPPRLAAWLTWVTGTRLYLAGAAGAALAVATGAAVGALLAVAAGGVLAVRARRAFRARWAVLMQMFEVAAAECRYPKGANLTPWAYIKVQRWEQLARPGTTVVTYPAAYQSEDLRTREKFERQFNGTVSDENTWAYQWESSRNRVVCQPTSFLPSLAPYPGPRPEWDHFALGVAGDDEQAVWNVSVTPHMLVAGPTGTGKSVLQRNILFHALAHHETWRIVAVDPKRVELGWIRKYPNVLKVAMDLEDGVEVVQAVRDELMRRYDEMEQMGANHFMKLASPPPALLVMIDETYNFLAPENIKSEEGKERDALHARATALLGEIARLGRACGVHLVLATQRPDAKVLPGELKVNCDARVAAGRMDTTPSLMVLDSEAATRLPKIKGRGIIRLGGETQVFQGYLAEQDWFDQWVAAQQDGGRGEEDEPAGVGRGLGARLGGRLGAAVTGRVRGAHRRVDPAPPGEPAGQEQEASPLAPPNTSEAEVGGPVAAPSPAPPVPVAAPGRLPTPLPRTRVGATRGTAETAPPVPRPLPTRPPVGADQQHPPR